MKTKFSFYFAASVVGALVTLASQNASANYFSADYCVMTDGGQAGIEVPALHQGGTIINGTGTSKIFDCPITSGAYSNFFIVGVNLQSCYLLSNSPSRVFNGGIAMTSAACPDGATTAETCYKYTTTSYYSTATSISCSTMVNAFGAGSVTIYYTT